MPKTFYSERDIEDLVRQGVMTLEIGDQVVLTDLAYEKAARLGLQLVRERPESPEIPPGAPIRPYLSQTNLSPQVTPSTGDNAVSEVSPAQSDQADLHQRIHSSVIAKLGTQIDGNLLDLIITRVLRSTGLK